jgi:hypothetical protein
MWTLSDFAIVIIPCTDIAIVILPFIFQPLCLKIKPPFAAPLNIISENQSQWLKNKKQGVKSQL